MKLTFKDGSYINGQIPSHREQSRNPRTYKNIKTTYLHTGEIATSNLNLYRLREKHSNTPTKGKSQIKEERKLLEKTGNASFCNGQLLFFPFLMDIWSYPEEYIEDSMVINV